MLIQVFEDLGQRWTFWAFPIRNSTVCVGEGGEGGRWTEWLEEGEGNWEVRSRDAADEVENVAGYGVFWHAGGDGWQE